MVNAEEADSDHLIGRRHPYEIVVEPSRLFHGANT